MDLAPPFDEILKPYQGPTRVSVDKAYDSGSLVPTTIYKDNELVFCNHERQTRQLLMSPVESESVIFACDNPDCTAWFDEDGLHES